MKKSIYLAIAVGLLLVTSCQKENSSLSISPEDQVALDAMIVSLNKSTLENDTCIIDFDNNNLASLHYHDSLYHFHVANFDFHHNNYSHGNNHDDHGHSNGQMNHHNGNMNHANGDGHHESNHTEMDNLHNYHQSHIH